MLSASQTASSSTFLRGDNQWQAAGVSVFYGEFTKDVSDATGTTTVVSSVGFTVKAIIFFTGDHNVLRRASWGLATSADQGALQTSEAEDAYYIPGGISANHSITWAISGSAYYDGAVTTFGSDGFTVTWNKTGSPTGVQNVIYMAIG